MPIPDPMVVFDDQKFEVIVTSSFEDIMSRDVYAEHGLGEYSFAAAIIDAVWYEIVKPALNDRWKAILVDNWTGDVGLVEGGKLEFTYWPES